MCFVWVIGCTKISFWSPSMSLTIVSQYRFCSPLSDGRNHFKGVLQPSALPTILGEFRSNSVPPYLGFNITLSPYFILSNTITNNFPQTQLHLHWLRLPTPFYFTRPLSLKDFSRCHQPTSSISPLRRGSRASDAGIAFSQDSTYSHTIRSRFQRRRAGAGRVF
jgi:hypothetical protein